MLLPARVIFQENRKVEDETGKELVGGCDRTVLVGCGGQSEVAKEEVVSRTQSLSMALVQYFQITHGSCSSE